MHARGLRLGLAFKEGSTPTQKPALSVAFALSENGLYLLLNNPSAMARLYSSSRYPGQRLLSSPINGT
jgi:hypothetical protein